MNWKPGLKEISSWAAVDLQVGTWEEQEWNTQKTTTVNRRPALVARACLRCSILFHSPLNRLCSDCRFHNSRCTAFGFLR